MGERRPADDRREGERLTGPLDPRRDGIDGDADGRTGTTGKTDAPAGDGPDGGVFAGLVTDDAWRPSTATDRTTAAVRPYLRSDESIRTADTGQLVGGGGEPVSVALTDERLLVVTDDSFIAVDVDGLSGVRSSVETRLGLRGMDFRLLGAVGYLLSVVVFLATLGVASNPLTPALTLVTGGAALAAGHLSREGLDLPGAGRSASVRAGRVPRRIGSLRRVQRRQSRA